MQHQSQLVLRDGGIRRPQGGVLASAAHRVIDSAEVADRGVRVTTIYPGRTATPMQAEVHRQEGRAYDPDAFATPEDVAGSIEHVLEMPRSATVPEISVR